MADNEPFITFVDPSELPEKQSAQESAITSAIENLEPIQTIPQPEAAVNQPVHAQAIVRTYHKDLSSVMGQNDPRIMSDILSDARNEEAVKDARNPISPKNKNYIVASAALLILGLSVLGFAVYRNYVTVQTLQQGKQLSLINAEMHSNITLADGEIFKNRAKITQALAVKAPLQTINHIFFTQQNITGLTNLSFGQTVALTGGTMPAELEGTLDTNFMYGTYQSDQPVPFLILRVNNYDDAFAGMRAWEPLMIDHLGFLFNLPESLRSNFNKSTFEDRIIANHAVRAVIYHAEPAQPEMQIVDTIGLPQTTGTSTQAVSSIEIPTDTTTATDSTAMSHSTTATSEIAPAIETLPQANPTPIGSVFAYEEGDTLLMYTFLNEHTILIATSEAVLREVLFRLANAQLLI